MYKRSALLSFLVLSACMDAPMVNSFRDMSMTPEQTSIPAGQTLPYGEISQACGVPKSAYGQNIANFPETSAKYQIYDTKPGSASPRTFYVTGFSDGCARQFTGSLAMFGSPETYEDIRYGPASKTLPVSTTDKAYEVLKVQVCNVPAGVPCGENMDKMAKNAVFLTVYKNFGASKTWTDVLIYGGKVLAFNEKKG